MRFFCAIALALAVFSTGCGLEPSGQVSLDLGEVEITASSPLLEREAKKALKTGAGAGSTKLILEERTSAEPTSLTTSGRASKRRLRYVLSWRMEAENGKSHVGDYRYSQLVDNDETTHRANRLVDRRFFANARRNGIQSMITEISFVNRKPQ